MALSGNLKEFELPDIFQLIGQQRKTGILTLTDKTKTSSVVFYKGSIVAADVNNNSPLSMLVHYLIYVHKYPESKINEFLDFCKGSISAFADVTLKIQYLSTEELYAIASMAVQDLACSLFSWKTGTYKFNPSEDIHDHRIDTVSFSTDEITMEAMRRIDEIKRMHEYIDENEIVVPADPSSRVLLATAPSSLFVSDTRKYVISLLDGRKTIKELIATSFVSQYRIYEALFVLIQSGEVISADQDDQGSSSEPDAAETAENALAWATTVSSLSTALIIALFLIIGMVILPGFVLKKQEAANFALTHAAIFNDAEQKVAIARVAFRIENGVSPRTLGELSAQGLLSDSDVSLVVAARKHASE